MLGKQATGGQPDPGDQSEYMIKGKIQILVDNLPLDLNKDRFKVGGLLFLFYFNYRVVWKDR